MGEAHGDRNIGILNEYKMGMNWDNYVERLEQYFIVNDIDENKKVPLLLTVMGD